MFIAGIIGQLERMLGTPEAFGARGAERWRDDNQVRLVYPLAWAHARADEGSLWHRCPVVLDAVNGLAKWAFSAAVVVWREQQRVDEAMS